MYLLNLWDLDDEFKQTPQISSTRLNQGFPDAQLFGAAISLHIDGFWGGCNVVFNTTPYLTAAHYFTAVVCITYLPLATFDPKQMFLLI